MQYLMVLLLSAGVLVLMVGLVLGASYGLGVFLHLRADSGADLAYTDPCASCRADRDWYDELPAWKRNLVAAWWLANRYRCIAKGCAQQ